MNRLIDVINKKERFVIGIMSGTSVDGVDAALCKITGQFKDSKVEVVAFNSYPFSGEIRERIFAEFEPISSSCDKICHLNFLLGHIFADAAISIAKEAGISLADISLIGSHGQTIYHIPEKTMECGYEINSTLQIGEGAVIAHKTGVITITDFRVADMAAGGLGAPLVPYAEYLLYRSLDKTVALQNIGGIGNITVIPAGCSIDKVVAFDTGPGNMIIDAVTFAVTNGDKICDTNGDIATRGKVNTELLETLMCDEYFDKKPPKTTGREYFGKDFTESFLRKCYAIDLPYDDIVATATAFTAKSIASARKHIGVALDMIVVGGGGAYNNTLMSMIKNEMPNITVMTGEQFGYSSDAKEAVAFAVLANETIGGYPSNVPSATGASHSKILGKINLP